MRLSLLHLIAGRVKVRDLKIDGAELVSENRDNIAALFGRVFPGGPSSGPAVPIPSVESFELRNGRVRFTDRVAGAPVVFDITGIAASLGKTPNGFIYRTSALLLPSGRISATGERRGPSITGRVRAENIGLESFTPYLRLSTAGVGGKADISADYGYGDSGAFIEGRVMYKGLFADLPGAFPLPLRSPSGSASFKVTSNGEGRLKEALTENIKIGMEGFEVNGAVSLKPSNAGVNAYTVDVKLSTTPLPS
ncbi:MAG: DUF748 domain-containing protein, partial [Deltaproteobacteria bacterium]|nr:DUF748 domain-containing protein [Deltaproteobacteria bacterium]